jgi:hypothetical protein
MIAYQIVDCLVMRPGASSKRGVLNELTARSGQQKERARAGTRSRHGFALSQLTWVASGVALTDLLLAISDSNEGWINRDPGGEPSNLTPGMDLSVLYGLRADELQMPWTVLSVVPALGVTQRFDAWIPWFGREIDRLIDRRIPWDEHGRDWHHHVDVGVLHAEVLDLQRRMARAWPSLKDWVAATSENIYDYSFTGAMTASRRWHDELYVSEDCGCRVPPGRTVAVWGDGGRIDRLVTKRGLELEGVSMAHCVGGYWANVRDGESAIFSYRGPDGVPRVTIELALLLKKDWDRPGRGEWSKALKVVQVQGPGDSVVSDRLAAARMLWWLVRVFGMSSGAHVLEDRLVNPGGDSDHHFLETESALIEREVDELKIGIDRELMSRDYDGIREGIRILEEDGDESEEYEEWEELNGDNPEDLKESLEMDLMGMIEDVEVFFDTVLEQLADVLTDLGAATSLTGSGELVVTDPRLPAEYTFGYGSDPFNTDDPIRWHVRVRVGGEKRRTRWPDLDLYEWMDRSLPLWNKLIVDKQGVPEGKELLDRLDEYTARWAPPEEASTMMVGIRASDLPEAPEAPRIGPPPLYLYTQVDADILMAQGIFGPKGQPVMSSGDPVALSPGLLDPGMSNLPGTFIGMSPDSSVVHVVWQHPTRTPAQHRQLVRDMQNRVRPLD